MKVAVAAYPAAWHPDRDALLNKLDQWVGDAAGQGADLLVFPEYAGIEAALIGTPRPLSAGQAVHAMCTGCAPFVDMVSGLAKAHGVHILSGSLCVKVDGQIYNRAHLHSPTGGLAFQDKLIPTPYERDEMGVTGGGPLRVFDTALGRLGVLVCYDSEFPLLARSLVASGADVLLVPSCTDQPAGQTRVRQSARARAIEGQCFVAQAPLVGAIPSCDPVDTSTGRAAIFCPPDTGLPANGIMAEGETDAAGWTLATLDLARCQAVRADGQVGNLAHWPEQERHVKPPRIVALD